MNNSADTSSPKSTHISKEACLNIWSNYIDKIGLSFEYESFGINNLLSQCTLSSKSFIATTGYGKGYISEVSAKYEALERFISQNITHYIGHQNFSLDSQLDKSTLLTEFLPQSFLFDDKFQSLDLAWTKFTNIFTAESSWAPICGINPFYGSTPFSTDKFPYQDLYLSASDNGTAITNSLQDSLIKSMLELIERDAWSFFLGTCILQKKYDDILIIKPDSLPRDLQILFSRLEDDTNSKLTIFKILNIFGVHTYGATFCTPEQLIASKGFSASFTEIDALTDAVFEAYQQDYIYRFNTYQYDLQNYKILENSPHLQQCMSLKLSELTNDLNFISFGSDQDTERHHSKKEKCLFLLEQFQAQNVSLYYKILLQTKNICCIQLISPTLENLFTLSYGILNSPKERLKKVLSNQ